LRSRTLTAANAVTVLIGTVAVGMPFVLTLYAQRVLGYSALKFGLSSVVPAVAATAGALAGPPPVPNAGFRGRAAAGMGAGCAAAGAGVAGVGGGRLVLPRAAVQGGYFAHIFVGRLLGGLGIGLAFVTATVAALAFVACAVLAGIGLVLALLLPGRPRQAAHG